MRTMYVALAAQAEHLKDQAVEVVRTEREIRSKRFEAEAARLKSELACQQQAVSSLQVKLKRAEEQMATFQSIYDELQQGTAEEIEWRKSEQAASVVELRSLRTEVAMGEGALAELSAELSAQEGLAAADRERSIDDLGAVMAQLDESTVATMQLTGKQGLLVASARRPSPGAAACVAWRG